MNRVAFVVYDDYLSGTGTSASDDTRVDLHHALALFDRLAMEVLVHDALTTMTSPKITVQIFHSGNGRRWAAKNTIPEINLKPITIGAQTLVRGYDTGSMPNLAQVRFAVTLTATNSPVRARVTLRVTATDSYALDASPRLAELMQRHSTDPVPDRVRTLR